jgi:ribosome-associated heat shock protein Hsp15
MSPKPPLDRLRLDKWLWAARLFKTRAAAAEAAQLGRVEVNGLAAKPGRELRPGDRLSLRDGGLRREFEVRGLSAIRGPAPVAQALYAETAESVAAREAAAARRRQGVEPGQTLAHGRPTKRDRRQLADWTRWSASADDPGPGPR